MKREFFYPFYYQKFHASTLGWSILEKGAYRELLDYQFQNGSIPHDRKEIRKICPVPPKVLDKILKKFHPIFDEKNNKIGLQNLMMNETIFYIKKQRENGQKGGRKPTNDTENQPVIFFDPQNNDNPNHNPNHNPNETQPVTQTSENNNPNHNHTNTNTNTNKLEKVNTGNTNEKNLSPFLNSVEAETVYHPIERCLEIAMYDERFMRANKTNKEELQQFNSLLEKRGMYEKNPMDYKTHFSNWKNLGKKDVAPLRSINGKNYDEVSEEKANRILFGNK